MKQICLTLQIYGILFPDVEPPLATTSQPPSLRCSSYDLPAPPHPPTAVATTSQPPNATATPPAGDSKWLNPNDAVDTRGWGDFDIIKDQELNHKTTVMPHVK
ncbi:hypothetical protein ACFX1S_003255 [Malus domestica]